MTDFLSRLAARASGLAPSVRPDLPARFESFQDTSAETPDHDVSQVDVSESRPPAPHPAQLSRQSGYSRSDRQRGQPALNPAPSIEAASPAPARRADGTGFSRVPAARRQPETSPVGAPAPPVVPAAPVIPPSSTRSEPESGSQPAANTESSEPVVRISIGRVEVRASLSTAPSPVRQETRATAPDPLPLHDYLRGRREAR